MGTFLADSCLSGELEDRCRKPSASLLDAAPLGLPAPELRRLAWSLCCAVQDFHVERKAAHGSLDPNMVLMSTGEPAAPGCYSLSFARPAAAANSAADADNSSAGGSAGGSGSNGSLDDCTGGGAGCSGGGGAAAAVRRRAHANDAARRDSGAAAAGTGWCLAPEQLLGMPYGPPADMFAFGCILAELATGQPLFPGASTGERLRRMVRLLRPMGHAAGLRRERSASSWAADGTEATHNCGCAAPVAAAAAVASGGDGSAFECGAINAAGNTTGAAVVEAEGLSSVWADVRAAVGGRCCVGTGSDCHDCGGDVRALRPWLLRQLTGAAAAAAAVKPECAVPCPAAAATTAMGDVSMAAAAVATTNLDEQLADLLESCLQLDPLRRATAEQALRMPYFSSYGRSYSVGRLPPPPAPGRGAGGAVTTVLNVTSSRRTTSEIISHAAHDSPTSSISSATAAAAAAPSLGLYDDSGRKRQQPSRWASSSMAEVSLAPLPGATSLAAPPPHAGGAPPPASASASASIYVTSDHFSPQELGVYASAPLISYKLPLDTVAAPASPPPLSTAPSATDPRVGTSTRASITLPTSLEQHPHAPRDAATRSSVNVAMAAAATAAAAAAAVVGLAPATMRPPGADLRPRPRGSRSRDARGSESALDLPLMLLQGSSAVAARYQQHPHPHPHAYAHPQRRHSPERRSLPMVFLQRGMGSPLPEAEMAAAEYDLVRPGECAASGVQQEAVSGSNAVASRLSGRLASGAGGAQHSQSRLPAAATAPGSQYPAPSGGGRIDSGAGGGGASAAVRRTVNRPPPLLISPDSGTGAAAGAAASPAAYGGGGGGVAAMHASAPGGSVLRDCLSPTGCRTSATAVLVSPRMQTGMTAMADQQNGAGHSGLLAALGNPASASQQHSTAGPLGPNTDPRVEPDALSPQHQVRPLQHGPPPQAGGWNRSPRRSNSDSQKLSSSMADPWVGAEEPVAVTGSAARRAQMASLLGPLTSSDGSQVMGSSPPRMTPRGASRGPESSEGLVGLDAELDAATATATAADHREIWPPLSGRVFPRSGRWSGGGGGMHGIGVAGALSGKHHHTDYGGGGGGRGPLPRLLNVLQRELIAQQQYPSHTISGGGGGGGGVQRTHTPSESDLLRTLSEACESSCSEAIRLPVIASVTQHGNAVNDDAVSAGGCGDAAAAASSALRQPDSQRQLAALRASGTLEGGGAAAAGVYGTGGLSPAAAATAKGLAQRARERLRQYFSDDGSGRGDRTEAAGGAAGEGDGGGEGAPRQMRSSVPASGGGSAAAADGGGGAGKQALMSTLSRAFRLGASIRQQVAPDKDKKKKEKKAR